MTTPRQSLGKLGEDLAVRYLVDRKWRIRDRNVRMPVGEIDVVAEDRGTLVFVEVRARSSRAFGAPEESITPAKRGRMVRCALTYLAASPTPDADFRIDLIAIEIARGRVTRLEHYEHVVQ